VLNVTDHRACADLVTMSMPQALIVHRPPRSGDLVTFCTPPSQRATVTKLRDGIDRVTQARSTRANVSRPAQNTRYVTLTRAQRARA
jgi:hypothetical protein